ncbi:ROK family transcriptional regulator [Dongia soli]|uniref:ROK family transcriptional regulator n=1 Tax=Dongia soli TaxID=600628 RepID=A0ABU5E8I7_9PROT|nr:ROK family transcriptional regulator [Dongia soli]MDY0882069.1 ROK family transcriptional regulator [Dongia soli]
MTRRINATAGTNLGGASAHNRRVVFDALRLNGSLSRAEIARATQLTPQTVSNIIDQFVETGLVSADAPIRGGRGQPATPYRIVASGAYSLGIHIDRHQILGIGADLSGRTLSRHRHRLPKGGAKKGFAILLDLVAAIRRDIDLAAPPGAPRLLGLGVAMPGPFGVWSDPQHPPADTLIDPWVMREWHEFPLIERLTTETGLEAVLQNDAGAAAMAEKMYGTASGLDHFVHLYIGYGLGAGLIIQGEIYAGTAGNAGEIGQLPAAGSEDRESEGSRTLEHYVSVLSACRALDLDPGAANLFPKLEALLAVGDPRLDAWTVQAGRHLRQAIQIVEALFDPQTVVVGGQLPPGLLLAITRHVEPLLSSVSHRPGRSLPRLTVGTADLWVVAQGAAMEPISRTFDPQFRALLKSA